MWNLILFAIFILLTLKYFSPLSLKPKKGFWKQYGIVEVDASHIVTELDILLGRKDITERDDHIYKELGESEKYCGTIENPVPVLLIKDLDLIKQIYIKSFDHFVDRRQFFGAASEDSVLLKMLGNLKGEEWKGVRASVTPAFTTGKIRRMMDPINSVATSWIEALRNCAGDIGVQVDAYKCMSNYTADVIAAAIFGLEAGTVQNPDSAFATMANRLTNMKPIQIIKFTLSLRYPTLFRFFNIDFLDMEALTFFEKLLIAKLEERVKKSDEKRNDFLQLMTEARKIQQAFEENVVEFQKNKSPGPKNYFFLTDKVIRGQCLSFFFAGFRTTSTFLTFAMYALALYQDVQNRLRAEVDGIFKQDGGLDYDDLGQLAYLEMVLCEVLRKFPATLRLERECVSDYHDPECGLFIPKGTFVSVPLHAIHNDKRFYENPQEFDPEHFRPEKRVERNPYAFSPFGIGNRNCIGMRFALLESKAALAYLVHNFIITPSQHTPKFLTGKRINFQIAPPENLELKLVAI